MMQSSSLSSHTPSFNTHSSSRVLSDIAARVIGEFGYDYEEYGICEDEFDLNKQSSSGRIDEEEEEEEVENCEESEFSFGNIGSDEASSLVSADEIFSNGQIRPVFPIFDTEFYLKNEEDHEVRNMINSAIGKKPPALPVKVRVPLGKLFTEERELSSPRSSSSSEDELNGLPPEIYCVWKPGKGEDEEAPEKCKKSNSMGMSSSSRRWRFRELIRRSRSDGGVKERV